MRFLHRHRRRRRPDSVRKKKNPPRRKTRNAYTVCSYYMAVARPLRLTLQPYVCIIHVLYNIYRCAYTV